MSGWQLMPGTTRLLLAIICLASSAGLSLANTESVARGWLMWRGPQQNGTSAETDLPDKVDSAAALWTIDLAGRGTPVINGNKVYVLGYEGTGPDLQQVLRCVEADSGRTVWEQRFNDFLSDTVYDRYSIGSPVIDRETGNVYVLTTAGEFVGFTGDGERLWGHSMMEDYGRLTFPNGRVGSPVIDDDLIIVRGITSNWGLQGQAADRFYAFDKMSGEIVWASTPGVIPPKDASFSTPILAWENGRRVLYSGTGDGSIVCVNARTGDPIWRYQISAGGVNGTLLLVDDALVGGHADENLDSSEIGRTVAVKTGAQPQTGSKEPAILDQTSELWRNSEVLLTSSPTFAHGTIYLVNKVGELCALDPKTGAVLWRQKLGADQLHASPIYADGKLYIPMRYEGLYVVKPGEKAAEVLSHTPLEGEALGAPAVWDGKIYVHTTKKLYCFGSRAGSKQLPSDLEAEKAPAVGEPAQIQVVPSEVTLRPGEKQTFRLRALDANGLFVKDLSEGDWKKFVPATAKVRSEMDAEFDASGALVAKPNAKPSAGSWELTAEGLKGYMRGRVLPSLPYVQDFETFQPAEQPENPGGVKFAWPPLPWIGARFKWDIREMEGNKVLNKTLDRLLFQRAFTFFGDSRMSNYTIAADVMSDGNKRVMSNVGVINQRYVINLVGNYKQLEVLSNQDRIKVAVPFPMQPKTWYRIESRVDVAPDGSGVIRAKAWKRDDPKPENWTIEVRHKQAHPHGAPGVYGFALQNQFPVYIDNVSVAPNK
jgi:outer membrane protein assembly factor BamB